MQYPLFLRTLLNYSHYYVTELSRVLFELALLRNIDEWLIMPQEAILSKRSDKSPEMPAKLLNPELTVSWNFLMHISSF